MVALVTLTSIVVSAQVKESSAWTFEHYSVVADFYGTTAKPILATRYERSFRTEIQTQAAKGPNFAGHYTVAKWGCGAPCLSFVIVDARTGSVYNPGFPVACADKNVVDSSVDFRLSSRLIVATSISRAGVCGYNYYVWNGSTLRLLHFEPWHASSQ